MAELAEIVERRTVGVRDIPLVLVSPRRLFARVEDVHAWGWPLVILLTTVTLIGYATVQTGLIDAEVDRGVMAKIDVIERQQRDVVERSQLRELYQQEYKLGEFLKLLARIQVIVAAPAKALAAILLIAAVLYGTVALTGRKPEWNTLLTICVFAGFIEVLRLLATLALLLHYRALEVDTSLALLAGLVARIKGIDPTWVRASAGLLSAADPFRLWYWGVVALGLSVTAQLPGWRAWVVCTLGWLVAAGVQTGLQVAAGAMSGADPGAG